MKLMIDKNLQFQMSTEENNTLNYLDIAIHRNNNSMDISIYRKLTCTDTTIQFSSSHPYEHKIAAIRYYIHRIINNTSHHRKIKTKRTEYNTYYS